MNYNDFEKTALKNEIQKLVDTGKNFTGADDCYCILMKQMFLSESTLN